MAKSNAAPPRKQLGPRKPVSDDEEFEDCQEQLGQEAAEERARPSQKVGRIRGKEPVAVDKDEDDDQPEEEEAPEDGEEPGLDEVPEQQPKAAPAGRKRRGAVPATATAAAKRPRQRGTAAVKPEPGSGRGLPTAAAPLEGRIVVPAADVHRVEQTVQNYGLEVAKLGERMGNAMTRQGLDGLTRLVVRHMLFRNAEQPGVPVPRADITKLISAQTTSKKQGLPGYIVALAQHQMLVGFGLEMKEVTKPVASRGGGPVSAPGEGSKYFVLRSVVPVSLHAAVVRDPAGDAVRGFLATVLALIELAGGKIAAEELWRHLADMGAAADKGHPTLGHPSTLLEELVKKRYIHRERVAGTDGEEVSYVAAENAKDEFGEGRVKAWYEAEFAVAGNAAGGRGDER